MMLARFARALQRGQIQIAGQGGPGAGGGTIVVDDNCLVSRLSIPPLPKALYVLWHTRARRG